MYLAPLKVGLEFAVVPSSFVNLVLLCLAERCLLAEEAEPRFSPAHGALFPALSMSPK